MPKKNTDSITVPELSSKIIKGFHRRFPQSSVDKVLAMLDKNKEQTCIKYDLSDDDYLALVQDVTDNFISAIPGDPIQNTVDILSKYFVYSGGVLYFRDTTVHNKYVPIPIKSLTSLTTYTISNDHEQAKMFSEQVAKLTKEMSKAITECLLNYQDKSKEIICAPEMYKLQATSDGRKIKVDLYGCAGMDKNSNEKPVDTLTVVHCRTGSLPTLGDYLPSILTHPQVVVALTSEIAPVHFTTDKELPALSYYDISAPEDYAPDKFELIQDWVDAYMPAHNKEMFEWYMGSLFVENNGHKQLLYLYDAKGSALKSPFTNALLRVVGSIGTSVNYKNLSKEQGMHALVGKRIAVIPDLKAANAIGTEEIHNITGGDTIQVRQLYMDAYHTKIKVKVIITSNNIPQLEAEQNIKSRLLLVDMQHPGLESDYYNKYTEVVGGDVIWKNTANIEDTIAEELPYYLYYCYQRYIADDMRKHLNAYIVPLKVQEDISAQTQSTNASLIDDLIDCLEPREGRFLSSKTVINIANCVSKDKYLLAQFRKTMSTQLPGHPLTRMGNTFINKHQIKVANMPKHKLRDLRVHQGLCINTEKFSKVLDSVYQGNDTEKRPVLYCVYGGIEYIDEDTETANEAGLYDFKEVYGDN